jgi:predicted O-methyltransferase YrrM
MMKPLVACFKTFRGGEWFEMSLESVRPHCAGIVVVSCLLPWKGLPGTERRDTAGQSENCREPLSRFRARHSGYPVTEVRIDHRCNSRDQYTAGLRAVRASHGSECGVLIIDSDEVWEGKDLTRLKEAMTEDRKSLYFRSGIWTYLRSPFYRVHPQERARVVVGLASPEVPLGDSRFSGLAKIVGKHRIADVDCSYHHFGYVRLNPEEITVKLSNTSSQDAVPNRLNWKQEVWDNLPSGHNIHPAMGYFSCWQGVKEIGLDDLPPFISERPEFWALSAHHKEGIPVPSLLIDAPGWREKAEGSQEGIVTTVPLEYLVPLSVAMRGRISQDICRFLLPRLRMSFRETAQLAQHACQVPEGGTILEVGSGMGGSVAVMASAALSSTRLVAVDPFVPYDEENVTLCKDVEVGTVEDFYETVSVLKGKDISLLRLSSKEAVGKFEDCSLDLVLVDGNHSFSHALFDLKAWWEKLRPGGVILLHDLSGRFPGVVRAAKEFEAEKEVRFNLPTASSLAWARKL